MEENVSPPFFSSLETFSGLSPLPKQEGKENPPFTKEGEDINGGNTFATQRLAPHVNTEEQKWNQVCKDLNAWQMQSSGEWHSGIACQI